MKLIDYIYTISFGGAAGVITQQIFNINILSILVGILAFITCYKITLSDYE